MSSEFLIAVPRELPKQDNLVNKGKEGKMFDEDYTNNHLEGKLSLSVPELPCVRNFPFNNNMKFYDMTVSNCSASRKHTLDDDLDTRLPKLIKLQPEYTNYRSETVVDMVDAVRSQIIKNDVILGENLENPSINKNEKTNPLVEETSFQQLAHETLDTCNSDHISMEAIGGHSCVTIDVSCSDRKATDHEQIFLKMEPECALLQIQNRNNSSASLVTGQDSVTETENLLQNTEKCAFYTHEFVGAETVADEYNIHESFSLSEFLICPTSFEQKESCDTLLHAVQEEEAGGSSATAASDIPPTMEQKDSQVMFQYKSEISGHTCTSFVLDNKSVGKDESDSITHPLCEAQKLSHSAEVGISSNLLHNKIPGSEVVTTGQTVVKEEFPIKQEVEENPILHTIHVPSVDLLHNRELDLVDGTVFQNRFMSLVNQETGTESISSSTYGHHESSDKGHTEDLCSRTAYKENLASALAKSAAAEEYSLEPHTKYINEIIGRYLPPPDLIGRSRSVQVADHYGDRVQSSSKANHVHRFLNFIPSAPVSSPTHKMEASVEKVKNPCEELQLNGLSVPTLPRSAVAQIPTTNVQPLENKSDFAAVAESDVENTAKSESDIIHKHHKKELIKKFSSSGLLEDGKREMNSSQRNVIQTETTMKDSAVPSTSVTATNGDKCVKDCIVISDSDDDSIIEFDVVKTCTKKRVTKSAHGGSSGKNTQQARNSTVKSSAVLECIVVSDSDDESSKPAPASTNRASNCSDEGASISDAESRVSLSDINRRNRTESHGVIDLSGGRSPSALSKSSSAVVPSASDSSVGALAGAFATGDSQSSQVDRLGAHNSGLDNNSSNTFTHIVAATITYNPAQSNLGRESNGGDVIDLSRRPQLTSLQVKSAVDVLDLSGSDKKLERHSVIKSVGTAVEDKSATKDIAEEKDSSPAWSCPICFESLLSGRQSVSSTPCGHVFCTKCIEEAVNQFKKCPTCCRKVALKRVHKIFL